MRRMNRRQFTWVATSGVASAALVACSGEAVEDDLTPTRVSNVEGAPPTLAPNATPFSSEEPAEEGGEEAAAGGGGGTEPITVTGLDSLEWDPPAFEAAPGQEILVVNGGQLQHDFVIDEWELATDLLNGGEEATVTVPEDAEVGTEVIYYCSVPGHREGGMEGTLTVVEAAAGGGEEAPEEEAAAAGGGEAVTVTGLDSLEWDPSELEVSPGQEIHVVNGGQLQHDFVVDEWEIATALLNGGEEETVTVPEDAEVGSQVAFYCSVPGHREGGMEGTITVVEGGGGGAAAAEEEAPEDESGEEEAAAAGGTAGEPITVEALDALQFDPSEIEAAPGQEIHVINVGSLQHDFVVDELGIATDLLNGGDEQTVTVPEDAEVGQSYTYYCSVPGHQAAGMEGTLTIVEGGSGQAAATDEEAADAAASDEESEAAAVSASVDPSQTITVEALDELAYNPSELAAAPGQTIKVVNVGTLQHDFVIDEWGLATSLLDSGAEEEITVPEGAEVGTSVAYYCSVPGHRGAGMEGTLTIAAASGAATAEAEEEPAAEATPDAAAEEASVSPVDLDDNAIRVSALDSMRFAPSQFSAAPGQQIHLVNPGVLIHDIVVDEWDLDSGMLGGGEETTFSIPEDAEVGAEFTFYCSVPGHRESGMTGTITIVEADARAAGAATPVTEATPAGESTPAGAATPAATPVEEQAAGGSADAVTVIAVDIAFEPEQFSIPADTDVEITLVNEGVLQHDLNIEETDFATELLDGGAEATITVNLPAGEYVYFCSVPGHREAGMEGTLTVE